MLKINFPTVLTTCINEPVDNFNDKHFSSSKLLHFLRHPT